MPNMRASATIFPIFCCCSLPTQSPVGSTSSSRVDQTPKPSLLTPQRPRPVMRSWSNECALILGLD